MLAATLVLGFATVATLMLSQGGTRGEAEPTAARQRVDGTAEDSSGSPGTAAKQSAEVERANPVKLTIWQVLTLIGAFLVLVTLIAMWRSWRLLRPPADQRFGPKSRKLESEAGQEPSALGSRQCEGMRADAAEGGAGGTRRWP